MEEDLEGSFQELRTILIGSICDRMSEEDKQEAISLLRFELDKIKTTHGTADYRSINKALNTTDYYVIQGDDLKFINECSAIATAIYVGVPNPVAIAGGLTAFLFRYRKKRIKLTMEEGLVLKTLAKAPSYGWTVEELSLCKPLCSLEAMPNVATILESLTSVRKCDNTTTALVEEIQNRWRTIDV